MNRIDKDNNGKVSEKDIMLSLPLSVFISAVATTYNNVFGIVFECMKFLVAAYFCYLILGKVLFVGLIVTPILVGLIYYSFAAYDNIMSYDYFDDDDDDDQDGGFNDHWNNKIK